MALFCLVCKPTVRVAPIFLLDSADHDRLALDRAERANDRQQHLQQRASTCAARQRPHRLAIVRARERRWLAAQFLLIRQAFQLTSARKLANQTAVCMRKFPL